MNTINHKINIVLAMLAFASAACASPLASPIPPKHYVIVAGQGLPKDQAAELLKQTFVLLLVRAAPGDHVELIAAPKLTRLADVIVPEGSMRSRANSADFAGRFGAWKAFLSEPSTLEPRQAGQLALPQLVDEIARSREPGQPTVIVLCGTPLFISSRATEEPFDMAGGLVPGDGAILASASQSIYGTADRKNELNGTTVAWFIPDDKWMLSQPHGRAVLRAWTCFFHELGANLCSWSSDCATVFDRAAGGDTTPAMVASLDPQDKNVRMERVPGFRLEQAMAKPQMAVEVASGVPTLTVQTVRPPPAPLQPKPTPAPAGATATTLQMQKTPPSFVEQSKPVEQAIPATPMPAEIPAPAIGNIGVAAVWNGSRDSDIDLYVAAAPGSPEAYWHRPNVEHVRLFRDIRAAQSMKDTNHWDWVWEYCEVEESQLNQSLQPTIWLNVYETSRPVSGIVRIQFQGHIVDRPFKFEVTRGNHGHDSDISSRSHSPYWQKVNLADFFPAAFKINNSQVAHE
jgi:hypothetical protein